MFLNSFFLIQKYSLKKRRNREKSYKKGGFSLFDNFIRQRGCPKSRMSQPLFVKGRMKRAFLVNLFYHLLPIDLRL